MDWIPKTLDLQCSFLCLAIIRSSYSLIKRSNQMNTDRYKSEYINALRDQFWIYGCSYFTFSFIFFYKCKFHCIFLYLYFPRIFSLHSLHIHAFLFTLKLNFTKTHTYSAINSKQIAIFVEWLGVLLNAALFVLNSVD